MIFLVIASLALLPRTVQVIVGPMIRAIPRDIIVEYRLCHLGTFIKSHIWVSVRFVSEIDNGRPLFTGIHDLPGGYHLKISIYNLGFFGIGDDFPC